MSRIDGTGQLIELMVSRPPAELFPPRNETLGDVMFPAHGLTRRGIFEDIDFEVRADEVLGVAGLVGAGRTEVMCAGIVTISSELPESMNVAHRIIVMSGARARDEIPLPAFDERRILGAAFAARIRERDHGEAIRGRPEIHDQDS